MRLQTISIHKISNGFIIGLIGDDLDSKDIYYEDSEKALEGLKSVINNLKEREGYD